MRRTLTLIGLSVLAWAFLPSPAGEAQRPAQEDPVFQFTLGLGSSRCVDRWQALERYLRSSGDRLKPLRQSLSTVSQPMRARLVPVVRFLEEDTRARSRVQSWEREFTRIAGIQDGTRQSSELEGMHQRLLGIISKPKEAFGARLDAATFMAVLVTEFAPPAHGNLGSGLSRVAQEPGSSRPDRWGLAVCPRNAFRLPVAREGGGDPRPDHRTEGRILRGAAPIAAGALLSQLGERGTGVCGSHRPPRATGGGRRAVAGMVGRQQGKARAREGRAALLALQVHSY